MAETIPGLSYGYVKGRFLAAVGDGTDTDLYPDGIPLQGTITFRLSSSAFLMQNASIPVTVLPAAIVCTLDANGYLTDGNGNQGVYLVATDDPNINPVGATYTVDFSSLRYGTNGTSYQSFALFVPGNTTIDLTQVAPVPASGGTPILRGPKGDKGDKGDPGTGGGSGTGDAFGKLTYDVRQYGDTSTAAGFTAAVNAWITAMGTPTSARRLFVPNGTYSTVKTYTDAAHAVSGVFKWGSNLGLLGESELGTIIQSPADATPFLAAYGDPMVNIEFSDFTLDCSAQASASYTTQLKGMFMQDITNLHVHHMTFIGSFGTSLGCDALVDYRLHDLTFYNPGRGITSKGLDPATVSGGSAIGIGTGKYQLEPGVVSNVIVHDAGRCALFYEKQGSYSYFSQGHVFTNVTAINCWAGVQDCGADGLMGDISVRNSRYGIVLDGSIISSQTGWNTHIEMKAEGNSIADLRLGHGGTGGHYISIDSKSGNAGVVTRANVTLAGGTTIDLKALDNHTGPAVDVITPANTVDNLTIIGRARKNSLGIRIDASTRGLHLNVDTSDSRTTPASTNGIYLKNSAQTHTLASIKGDVRGNTLPASFEAAMVNTVWGLDTYDVTTPTGPKATAGDSQANLTWTAPSTVTPTDYVVQYKTSAASTWTTATRTASTTTTQVVTGLTNGTTYNFRVASIVAGSTGNNSAVASTTPASAGATFTNTTAPAITGTATTGSVLTVTDGTYSSAPDSTTRQWYRAGTAISGATASTYTLVTADVGQAITVIVTAVKSGFTTLNTTSNTVTPTAAGTPGGTVVQSDTFNRTNASSPGTTDGGTQTAQAWTVNTASTTWQTNGTALKTASSGLSTVTIDHGTARRSFTATYDTINTTAGSRQLDMIFGYTDDANYYFYSPRGSGDGNWALIKRTGGTNGTVVTGSTGPASTAGDTVRIDIDPTAKTIGLTVNGTLVNTITISDATFLTKTKDGFRGVFTTDTISSIGNMAITALA